MELGTANNEAQSVIEALKKKEVESQTRELEMRSTIDGLKKNELERDKKIASLQELIMELCDKTDVHGGSEAYWEVRDKTLRASGDLLEADCSPK